MMNIIRIAGMRINMKKNNKGFTLVEILAVIVLIAFLLGVGIPGVNRISRNMKKKSLNTKIGLIEQAGVLWGQDNKTLLQATNCEDKDGNATKCYKIEIERLIEDDYLDSESNDDITYKNPVDDAELKNKCVYVYKKSNRVYAYFSTSNNCDGAVAGGGGDPGGGVPIIDKPNIVASDGKNSGEWHNADFTLNFTATSGTEIYYGFDASNVNTNASSFFVNEETSTKTIYVKACNGSTCSENAIYEIKLDKIAPIISYNPLYIIGDIVRLEQNALYELGDYVLVSDNFDSSPELNFSTFGGTNTLGTTEITYTARDEAGNVSSKKVNIKVVLSGKDYVFVGLATGGYNSFVSRYTYNSGSWNSSPVINSTYATNIYEGS